MISVLVVLTAGSLCAAMPQDQPGRQRHVTVDLNIGEEVTIELDDGSKAVVKLESVLEVRDSVREALREAHVKLEINGETATLVSANYRLPTRVGGVQIDCSATKGLYRNHDRWEDSWGLDKDVRLRLWPKDSSWMPPGDFVYPIKQRWFASATQMSNEPAFVDGGDAPAKRPIYYHNGLDIGGCEGLDDVVAATEGLVVAAGTAALPGLEDSPIAARYDVVYVRDSRDWYYRYSHLKTIKVTPGDKVKLGQKLGVLGKEGSSGGWSHLHFDIKARQPSGKWGTEDGYAFLWEAYLHEYKPKLLAVARPHHLIWAGEKVTLDGSRSWIARGEIDRFEWAFTDGTTATTPRVERTYDQPGEYSEILKVVDRDGNVDYDFAIVLVIDRQRDGLFSPTIHASYAPTQRIRPGDPVTFKVRTFQSEPVGETWNFGDGCPPVAVRSDANANPPAADGYAETIHRFAKAGHYLVRCQQQTPQGATVTARLHVYIEDDTDNTTTEADGWKLWLDRKLLPQDEARNMLSAFVEQQIRPLPLPQSLDDWNQRREKLRSEILEVLGVDDLVPPKWDLKLTHKGTLQRDDYHIEKFTFETYPGFANAAVLYIPKNVNRRVPGIVSISGHTRESKAADYVQQRNVNLVKRGCVVLSYDYFGMNERNAGHREGGPNSHGIRSFSYSRRTPTGLEVLDAMRAIDVLAARAEVDPERIGFTGESGGSNSTYWIAAVDPRVKLAVPVSSVTTFDYWIRGDINWDWHQRPPGIRRLADIGTLLALHAPHPLVIISSQRGTDDQEFPLPEAEKSHQWARHVYGLFDAHDQVTHYESTTGHGYQQDKREQLYLAVERWLKPPFPQDGQELPAKIELADDLRCGLPENNQTFEGIFAEWLQPLPQTDVNDLAQPRTFLRQRLGWPETLSEVKHTFVGRESRHGWTASFWLVETEPGIRVPVVGIGPEDKPNLPLTLVPGRDTAAVTRALQNGHQVLAFDLRGVGETASGKSGTWAWMAGEPWATLLGNSGASWSNWSWFAGRPVPGQWALDIVQVAQFGSEQYQMKSVTIDADNDFGWPALLAGAVAPDLIISGRVQLRHKNLQDDIRTRGNGALSDVPGILEQLDIPQIRQLWPGEVTLKR